MTIEPVYFANAQLALSAVITVKHQFKALHRWAECPYEEQAFLRNWHRHVFHVTLSVAVGHNDRDFEFFRVQGALADLCSEEWEQRQVEMSCEMFAVAIIKTFIEEGFPVHRCTVSEDGENEAQVVVRNLHLPAQSVLCSVPTRLAALLGGGT